MRSGELRHYIHIEQPIEDGPDVYGRRQIRWDEYASVYAKVSDVSGREFYAAAAVQLENVVTFGIRYLSGLRNDMRIVFGGRAYEIMEINHLGYRGDFMNVKARIIEAEAHG